MGVAPVAGDLEAPAEIGGELELIYIEEFFPKQTLSLGLGGMSPITDPPDVVSSLVTGKKAPELDPDAVPAPDGAWFPDSSLEVRIERSSRFEVREGEG